MTARESFHARVMALPAAAHLDPCYDRVKTDAEIQFAYLKGGRAGTDAARHFISPLIKRHAAAAIAAEADTLLAAAEGLRVALLEWKRAESYAAQYAHLPDARDDITEAWINAAQKREAALADFDRVAGAGERAA